MKYHHPISALLLGLALSGAIAHAQEKPDRAPKIEEEGWRVRPLRLTVRVVDENGKAFENAEVHVLVGNEFYYHDEYNEYRGRSGTDGKFSVESEGCGYAHIGVSAKGYYGSHFRNFMFTRDYSANGEPADAKDLESKKGKPWQPWDPTIQIMLKRIIRPIPMLIRTTALSDGTPAEAMALDRDMEWDMFEGMWLPPYGNGRVADLVVRFAKAESGAKPVVSMDLRFANESDGLIPVADLVGTESDLRFPREAPSTGYDLKSFTALHPDDRAPLRAEQKSTLPALPKCYFIRVRTGLDKKGNVVSAYYGKITTNLGLVPPESPIRLQSVFDGEKGRKFAMNMLYYLNPVSLDRNLEFDGKNNKAGNDVYIHVFRP